MSTTLESARLVLELECEAISQMAQRLDASFERAIELMWSCAGRVVVTGLGKSGAIGRKIASTLSSTGTPALFLHAAEGLHGDLGMVARGDVLLAISYSGRSDELLTLVPAVRALGVPVIALTGSSQSYLALNSDIVLDAGVAREACPLNLAPTSSTTVALALGDALAVVLMEKRGFAPADFLRFHPGGTLGRGANLTVGDLMRSGDRVALCAQSATFREVLQAVTRAGAGAAILVDEGGFLAGYLTDGDLRRHLLRAEDANSLLHSSAAMHMTRSPLALRSEMAALDALRLLQERRLNDAPVVDAENRPVGWLEDQELLRAGLM
ncbi:MAG: KpsF/GutQ family sugar-phosphate isomerase [Armatimonadetes bacterium]|nr:KpsF/GutQ family sugar-phosphate isomerase [Armatimonadota bacterium]